MGGPGTFPLFTSAARVRIRPKRGYTDMSVECNEGGLEGGYGERVSPGASGAVCSGTSGVGGSQATWPCGRAPPGAGRKTEGSAWIAGDVVSPGDGGGGGIGGGEGGGGGLAATRCATITSPATPVGSAWRESGGANKMPCPGPAVPRPKPSPADGSCQECMVQSSVEYARPEQGMSGVWWGRGVAQGPGSGGGGARTSGAVASCGPGAHDAAASGEQGGNEKPAGADGAVNGGPSPAPRPAARVSMRAASAAGAGAPAAASVATVAAMGTVGITGTPGCTHGGGAMVGGGPWHVRTASSASSAAAEAAASSVLGPAGGGAGPRSGRRRRNACAA